MKNLKCACIETLYSELPFPERFRAAKADGFAFVEFWSWTDKDLEAVRAAAEAAGIGIAGFNGDADYSLIDPAQRQDYLDFLRRSAEAAKKIGAKAVTIHSNALGEGGVVADRAEHLTDAERLAAMADILPACARIAEETGIRMNLEALNIVTDHPGNFLQDTKTAAELVAAVDSPMLGVLFDAYHMYLNGEDLESAIQNYSCWFGHVHAADAPGRHEPGTGEMDYGKIYGWLEAASYEGLIGYELFPETDTRTAVKAIMEL